MNAARRTRSPRRRALTVLLVGPLLCGLVLAGGITVAWVALGQPVPHPARRRLRGNLRAGRMTCPAIHFV